MTDARKPSPPNSGHGATAPVKQACSTCPKYLTFQVRDARGALCVGMYYSVHVEGIGWLVKNGVLDAEAKTQIFESSNNGRLASLCIGHRQEGGLPEVSVYDECPLHEEVIASGDHTYTAKVTTKRFWKPWSFSSKAAEESKTEWEKERRYVYDDGAPNGNWDGTSTPIGTLTIGAGHALFSTDQARDWYNRYPPDGSGMTDVEIDDLYAADVRDRAGEADLNSDVHVPLYQREFDAIIDLRFNAGLGASDYKGGRSNAGQHVKVDSHSIADFLSFGQYTTAGDRILTTANTIKGNWSKGVQNRRNFQRGMFFDEAWQRE